MAEGEVRSGESGSSRLAMVLLLGGVALVGLVGTVAVVVLSMASSSASSSSSSPGDRAADYIRGYYDNDPGAVFDLIAPAQQRLLDRDAWEECHFARLDSVEDGSDPDDPDAVIETIQADEEGVWEGSIDGDGQRRYELVETVVRATSDNGEFEEFNVDMVKDGDEWYVRFDDFLFSTSQPCEGA